MLAALPIVNLDEAKFECTFGRGCDGICCREGRPPVYADEVERIAANLDRFLPALRPEARAAIERHGFLSPRRRRFGLPLVRVADGWCVFFNKGCVLHQFGVNEGDKFRYKPCVCSLFPLQKDEHDQWYIRQKGYKRERWPLFCLDPCNSAARARDSLAEEIALAMRFDDEEKQTEADELIKGFDLKSDRGQEST